MIWKYENYWISNFMDVYTILDFHTSLRLYTHFLSVIIVLNEKILKIFSNISKCYCLTIPFYHRKKMRFYYICKYFNSSSYIRNYFWIFLLAFHIYKYLLPKYFGNVRMLNILKLTNLLHIKLNFLFNE